MIIEGGTHNNAVNLARYLTRCKPGEKAFVYEIRAGASDDLRATLNDWQACGRTLTRGEKILFHSYVRLPENEAMEEKQWRAVIDRLEDKLGLAGFPRAVIGHNSDNGLHFHIAWSRLNVQEEKLAPLHNSRRQFHAVARWAEREFKLTPVMEKPEKKRRLSKTETRAIKDRGVNRDTLQKIVRTVWNASTSGQDMLAMLKKLDCSIEKGDRRDYVINFGGLKLNPVRLLEGVTAATFRERMQDVAPTIEAQKLTNSDAPSRRRSKELRCDQLVPEFANSNRQQATKAEIPEARVRFVPNGREV